MSCRHFLSLSIILFVFINVIIIIFWGEHIVLWKNMNHRRFVYYYLNFIGKMHRFHPLLWKFSPFFITMLLILAMITAIGQFLQFERLWNLLLAPFVDFVNVSLLDSVLESVRYESLLRGLYRIFRPLFCTSWLLNMIGKLIVVITFFCIHLKLMSSLYYLLVINHQLKVGRSYRKILPLAIYILQGLKQLPTKLVHHVHQRKRNRPGMSTIWNDQSPLTLFEVVWDLLKQLFE